MPPLTTATISLELLQDCLGTLEQLTTGITNLGVEATSNPLQAPRVRVLLVDLLTSLQNCENDLGTYEGGLFDLLWVTASDRCRVLRWDQMTFLIQSE